MSKTHLERSYYCWNDCRMEGCPGHTATLDYQSVSDWLTLDDGKGQKFYLQTPELEAFAEMLQDLSDSRVEIKSALKCLREEQPHAN